MIAPLGETSAHFAPGPAGPAVPAGPGGPCGPARSWPLLKSRAMSEKSFTCTVVTLFRGSRVTAYPVPARPKASARQATTIAGEGARRRMRRMRASLVAGPNARRPSPPRASPNPGGVLDAGKELAAGGREGNPLGGGGLVGG